ncbi:RING-H2 finger protein [Melia azedarach]|uniref:RING-H2 finger protein n=2 Tax=Melia azedarach TaxID=155640 RepID=A0ACC1XVM2_MELAZ|nr:RING-H2 finger protein [Melia azedarach]KAJ4715398.1 RING-H2 finger protein [Melia azedarach]
MSSTSLFSSTLLFQDFLGKFHSRKLLGQNSLNQQPVTAVAPPDNSEETTLDLNIVLILFFSALACAVICSVALKYLIRCSRLVYSESRANSSTGINKKALKTFPIVKYSAELKFPGLDTECVVCLSEFAAGERVRLLPKCNHGFHVRCIDKWLSSHSSCPKCRNCLIETCEKIVGTQQSSSSTGISVPVPEIVVSIRPLEPEGILRS